MRVGLAQLNPTVGDIRGNARLILEAINEAKADGCALVLTPEMCLTGYPPEDLLLKPAFVAENLKAVKEIAKSVRGIAAVIGFVDEARNKRFNAAAWIENGRVAATYHKRCLPNYGVFDEKRYFSPGEKPVVRTLNGTKIGLTICEDIWILGPHLLDLKKQKVQLLVNISASPYHVGKLTQRYDAFKKSVRFVQSPMLYCNMTGGQDELVFDGGSFIMTCQGKVAAQFPQFRSGLHVIDIESRGRNIDLSCNSGTKEPLERIEEIHAALVLGLHDYVEKNGFKKVAIGLSGGIDSALVATLAAEALGPQNVVGVTMPTRFNLAETKSDAALVAKNLGIEFHEIPIQNIFNEFLHTLEPLFKNAKPNIAEENLQARIRGNLLMALSNKFGWLVLTTGNKSEMSTGYSTLYGDTAGGFAVIKDVLKTTVYELSKHINKRAGKDIIPNSTIARAPTAELRENQKDEDSLGPYATLDPLIVDYVEKNMAIYTRGDYEKRISLLIDRSEYKRRQNPPGIKITPRSFGRDHRMPITNRYVP